MAVGFLKKAKSLMPERSVKFLLHKHLSGFDPARSMKVVHASELTKPEGFCPRYYALADMVKYKGKDRWLTTSERMTFQIGRDQEKNLVNWMGDMNKAVCHWKCVSCGHPHQFQLRPVACETCGVKRFDPVEVRFQSAVNSASCGVDMLLALGEPKLRPVEIKTIDKEEFKALKGPLAEHKWRSNLYLRLIAESNQSWANMVGTETITILYVSKGGFGCLDEDMSKWGLTEKFSPFKEFTVSRDDSQTDDLVKRARVVKDFRDDKVGMPCGICSTAMAKRAATCPLRGPCFSGDHAPAYDWNA